MRLFLAMAFLVLLAGSGGASAREPVVGLPCDGCEAVFEGLLRNIPARSRIAPRDEPGQPLTLTGRVYGAAGDPVPGIVVYAYQTNAGGVYPRPARPLGTASARHGTLRGWARTGADGRYRFDTIRPGSYPSRDTPQHIHMHVIEPGCAAYYIDDVMFTDDPLLTARERRRKPARAGSGIVTPIRSDGRWLVTRDIRLGADIPGYPRCGAGRAAD